MVISKVLGMGISYKSNEAFVKPDDLDNFVIKGRKLVDKNYRNFKNLEDKYLSEYNKYDRLYNNIISSQAWESIQLEESGIEKKVVDEHLNQKYSTKRKEYYNKCYELKKEYKKITGKELILLLLLLPNIILAQKSNWVDFSKEKIVTLEINKTKTYKIYDFAFNVVWNEKLSFSENIGYYGGIKTLIINKGKNQLQTINTIEDKVGLGNIYFSFYDYNFDGYIDFSIPIDCGKNCWEKYYLFNPKSNKFEHKKDWDYLRIKKVDKKNKMVLSESDGNVNENNEKTYKIKGLEINEIKKK